jgi:hypothetical protein
MRMILLATVAVLTVPTPAVAQQVKPLADFRLR